MSSPPEPFFAATQDKLVVAFLCAGLGLLLALGVSKLVFDEILGTLEKSLPK